MILNLIICTPLVYFIFYFFLTRGITFQSVDTDNEKQAGAAASWQQWRTPSGMHAFGKGKTAMKDSMIILLSIFQIILFDKKTDRPLIVLCFFANAISAYLIYLIGLELFDSSTASLLLGLFITAIWPTQVAFFGGHICVGQMFFLLGAACCIVPSHSSIEQYGWFAAAGVSFIASQFASASSRKFLPLVVACFIYGVQKDLSIVDYQASWFIRHLLTLQGLFTAIAFAALILTAQSSKSSWLQAIKASLTPKAYFLIVAVLYLGVVLLNHASIYFYVAHLTFLMGIASGLAFFMLPNIKESFKTYLSYWNIPKTTCRFRLYVDFFKRAGHPISEDFRGEGWRWIGRILLRFVPLQAALAFFSLLIAISISIFVPTSSYKFVDVLLVALISLSPAWWGEVTKGPQISRSYLPVFIGLLLVSGLGIHQAQSIHGIGSYVVSFSTILVGFSLIHSLYEILTDVYPSRMVSTLVARKLKKLGVNSYSTYETVYNEALTDCPEGMLLKDFKINRIGSLSEISDGYVVVPCISSKAFHLESMPWSMEYGDYTLDHTLSFLIDSGKIERLAVAKLPTFGTSNYWVHESEVTSYRKFVLGDIREKDINRSYAWILDGKKVREFFVNRHSQWGAQSSHGSKLAIIVPTMNRSAFAIRTIRYFRDTGFKGALYISDSSAPEHFEKTKAEVMSVRSELEVYHLDCTKLNFSESVDAALMQVERPYVAYLGDDDFFILSGLDEAASFMDSHPEYSAAHGESACFTLDESGPYGNINSVVHYPEPSLEHEHPLERLFAHLCSYLVTIFSVHRTETFHLMTRDVFDIPERIFRDEMTACCLSTVFGKVKRLDSLCLIRQGHDQRYVCPSQFDWVSNLNWARSYNYFLHILSREIAVRAGVKVSELHESVRNALSVYIARSVSIEVLKTGISLPTDIPAKPWTKEMFIYPGAPYAELFAPVMRAVQKKA